MDISTDVGGLYTPLIGPESCDHFLIVLFPFLGTEKIICFYAWKQIATPIWGD